MTNRWLPFVLLVAAAASGPGCKRDRRSPEGARLLGAAGELVARGDGFAITVADVQNRINTQPPVARGQYALLDKKKELVTDLVNYELLGAEAVRRGYDREISDPIPTEEGFRILRLAARLPGYSRPLSDVTPQIRQQLAAAARTKALTDFVAGLRA